MCGIAGFCLSPDEHIKATRLARVLLTEIESRGRDAAGAAWWDPYENKHRVEKLNVPAKQFAPRLSMPGKTRAAVLHTRAATQGSPLNPGNNHPIPYGSIIGVHNGWLMNDDRLFREFNAQRIAQVDSEAIFMALHFASLEADADEKEILNKRLRAMEKIDGAAAIAFMSTDDLERNTLHLARISSNPITWGITEGGSFIFASTDRHLENTAKELGIKWGADSSGKELTGQFNDGEYVQIVDGMVVVSEKFEPIPRSYASYGNYSRWTAGNTTNWWDDSKAGATYVTRKIEPDGSTTVITYDEDTGLELSRRTEARTMSSSDQYAGTVFRNERIVRGVSPYFSVLGAGYENKDSVSPVDDYFTCDPAGMGSLVEPLKAILAFKRGRAIEETVRELERAYADETTSDRVISEALEVLKATAKPGDSVLVNMMGRTLHGYIIDLPDTFPEGVYTLRVKVPTGINAKDRTVETALIQRTWEEFKVLSPTPWSRFSEQYFV